MVPEQSIKVKEKYKVTNWSEYNNALKQRGSLTIWFSEEAISSWEYQGKRKPGGKIVYSDLAIQTCLIIKQIYHLKLRQTEGFLESLVTLSGLSLPIPDYSSLCRRARELNICLKQFKEGENISIIVDSTGLKVFGEGEWKVRKYGWSKYRTWRKLHIGLDPATQEIVAVKLTENNVDDAEVVPDLLDGISSHIKSFTGDGAYDKNKVRKVLALEDIIEIIPPQHNAVLSKNEGGTSLPRDEAIKKIKEIGRTEWKKQTGYHKRSLVEVGMYRYKTIIGDKISSRRFENEVTEVKIGCLILNRMTRLGMPISRRVA
jgi:hypothetical protein